MQAHHAGVVAQSDDKSDHLLRRLNAALEQPFGDVPIYWRCLAFAMWQEGYPIHVKTPEGIFVDCPPLWVRTSTYRVLPKPEELVLPSIDWSHVTPGLKFLVQDSDGTARILDRAPLVAGATAKGWSYLGCFVDAAIYASFKPGNGDWRKLIVQRPEGQ
ncbi:hypothetical protein [Paraburkholderia tropica]|uniref:hypothetical protein n=1 Tax=Paraburkholderia tropica TaxID=92647 RepID=UPI002AB796FD|nr:hypothetical protein [Paraburkholderia tropica]